MSLINSWNTSHDEYLEDESGMTGRADSISFPQNAAEAAEVVRLTVKEGLPLTIQGGMTGLCGGGVPMGGRVLNLTRMNSIKGLEKTDQGYLLRVEAGLRLDELNRFLAVRSARSEHWDSESLSAMAELRRDRPFFWPPDPSEGTATIGGILSVNAQGISQKLYGDTRDYVQSLTILDSQGNWLELHRDGIRIGERPDLVSYAQAWGLSSRSDLLDLYLGTEGIHGIIVEAVLRLKAVPAEIWGIAFFFESETGLFRFADALSALDRETDGIAALEYIDGRALKEIAKLKETATRLQSLPEIDPRAEGMIYVELHGQDADNVVQTAEKILEAASDCGCREEASWALTGAEEIEKIRLLRHGAPESINIAIKKNRREVPGITKLSADWSLPGRPLMEVVPHWRNAARQKGLEIAIFGHLPDNRLHVNLLPDTLPLYEEGVDLMRAWQREAAALGGKVFLEHGVGKLKRRVFAEYAGNDRLKEVAALRAVLDPDAVLNRGNIIEEAPEGGSD